MALVTTKEMFKKAYEGGYAIGAFNVNNMEIVQGITEAAQEQKAPVILQVSAGARKYAKHSYLVKLVEAAIEETGVDLALHLDHGADFEICKSCIDGGFTSVMIDGSHHSFEDNIAVTRRVVEYAHDRGVVVEAELGRLAGIEDAVNVSEADSSYTDPAQVEEFVTRTGVDSLAIAIGTSHGAYKFKPGQKPQLRFDILEEVERRLPGFPIVLHGASSVMQEYVQMVNQYGGQMPGAIGIPEEMLREAAKMAVCKINIDSDIRLAMTAAIRRHLVEHPDHFDPRQYLADARDAVKEVLPALDNLERALEAAKALLKSSGPSRKERTACRSAGVSASRSAAVLLRVCPVRGLWRYGCGGSMRVGYTVRRFGRPVRTGGGSADSRRRSWPPLFPRQAGSRCRY